MSDAPAPRTRLGTSSANKALRRAAFTEQYLTNGHNAGKAAIAVGYAEPHAHVQASRLLAAPETQEIVATRAAEVAEEAQLSTRNWARDLAACAFSSVGDLYTEDGELKPIHKLPEQVKRAISSVRVVKRTLKDVGTEVTTEIKFWDKNVALNTVAKHLGLFERDNAQKAAAVRVQIELVG